MRSRSGDASGTSDKSGNIFELRIASTPPILALFPVMVLSPKAIMSQALSAHVFVTSSSYLQIEFEGPCYNTLCIRA